GPVAVGARGRTRGAARAGAVSASPFPESGPGASREFSRDPPPAAVCRDGVSSPDLASGRHVRSPAPVPRRAVHRGGRNVLRAAGPHRAVRVLPPAPAPVHGDAARGLGRPPAGGAGPSGVLLLHPRDRPRGGGLRPPSHGPDA